MCSLGFHEPCLSPVESMNLTSPLLVVHVKEAQWEREVICMFINLLPILNNIIRGDELNELK